MEITYRSKVDTWLGALLLISMVGCAVGLYPLIEPGQREMILPALIVLPLGIVLPAWLLAFTTYSLTATDLLIRSGPFKWIVPIASITSITATSNPVSSPALSLDRLDIRYGNQQSILISPRDKQGFLGALAERRGGAR